MGEGLGSRFDRHTGQSKRQIIHIGLVMLGKTKKANEYNKTKTKQNNRKIKQ